MEDWERGGQCGASLLEMGSELEMSGEKRGEEESKSRSEEEDLEQGEARGGLAYIWMYEYSGWWWWWVCGGVVRGGITKKKKKERKCAVKEAVSSQSHVWRTHWDCTFCIHPKETGKEEEVSRWSEIRCFLLITSSCDDHFQTQTGFFSFFLQQRGQRLTSTCPDPRPPDPSHPSLSALLCPSTVFAPSLQQSFSDLVNQVRRLWGPNVICLIRWWRLLTICNGTPVCKQCCRDSGAGGEAVVQPIQQSTYIQIYQTLSVRWLMLDKTSYDAVFLI